MNTTNEAKKVLGKGGETENRTVRPKVGLKPPLLQKTGVSGGESRSILLLFYGSSSKGKQMQHLFPAVAAAVQNCYYLCMEC